MTNLSSNQKNALIELKHIELELINGRHQHLRHFVDQYHCYKNNFVKRTGHANWEGVVWNGFVSVEARQLGDRKKVVKEHVVPLRVVTQLLVELGKSSKLSCDAIAALLDKYVIFATISKREDELLRKNKLTSSMPKGYHEKGDPLYNNLLARYMAVGILLEDIQPAHSSLNT
jgi:hypothetical protein